ncbi:unnamed protein product, partial [Ascophyllum nodosum]
IDDQPCQERFPALLTPTSAGIPRVRKERGVRKVLPGGGRPPFPVSVPCRLNL